MTTYKLTYFDIRRLGEMIRMILTYGGQKFEDNRIQRSDWPALKSKTPFGQIPVLEVDGKELAQSFAIARFLARKFGLAGNDDWESAQLDAIADAQRDFNLEILPYFRVVAGLTTGDKDKLFEEVFKPAAEKHFPRLEKLLQDSACGFFGKSGPSWVDFFVSEMNTTLKNFCSDYFDKHQALVDHIERVHNISQLKDYIKSRKASTL